MAKQKRIRTVVRMDRVGTDGGKKHFRSMTFTKKPKDVWSALEYGATAVLEVDVEAVRAQRKRKGGKRGY